MAEQTYSIYDTMELANEAVDRIVDWLSRQERSQTALTAYPVPRGGVPALLAITTQWERRKKYGHNLPSLMATNDVSLADIVIDDLIDTGRTERQFPNHVVFPLIDKRVWEHGDDWVVWPWEGTSEAGIEDHITRLLQFIGDDPTRGGLLETPHRVAKAWKFWGSGYGMDPADVLKTFEDGAEGADEMVIVRNIPFYTHCEHHMAPFFGTCTIAYLPNKKIVGLSKLSRVLDIFARRLQVQERLGAQIADALVEHLDCLGCGVVITARHLCMESRGICKQGSDTRTSALRGLFKDDPTVRAEFLQLAR